VSGSTFVGFDPDLVAHLRRAARQVIDELRGLRSDDVAAASAVATAGAAADLLERRWLPVLDAVLRTAVAPTRGGHGLEVVDLVPQAGRPTVSVAEAAELGTRLAGGRGVPADHLGLAALHDRLALIVDDPALLAALSDALGDPHELLTSLGELHHRLATEALFDPSRAADVATVESLVGRVVVVLRHADAPRGHGPWVPAALDGVEPYVTALLLPHLALPAVTTAAVAARIIERAAADLDRTADTIDRMPGPAPGAPTATDLVARTLASRPRAATELLVRMEGRWTDLVLTSNDLTALDALVLAGTDPATTSTGDAGLIVRAMLRELARDEALVVSHPPVYDHGLGVLGTVTARWLPQFAGESDDWGWDRHDGRGALRWVLDEPTAARRLREEVDAWLGTLDARTLLTGDGHVDRHTARSLATTIATVEVILREEEIEAATAAAAMADVVFGVAGMLVPPLVQRIAPSASGVVEEVAPFAWGPIRDHLTALGLAPPDAATGRARARARFGSRVADTAVVATVAVTHQLVERGRVPADALDRLDLDGIDEGDPCAVAETYDRLVEYVDGLPVDEPLRQELDGFVHTFVNPLVGEEACGGT